MRLQLALNVRDIDEAVDYYGKLFGAAPHKRRPGYANIRLGRATAEARALRESAGAGAHQPPRR